MTDPNWEKMKELAPQAQELLGCEWGRKVGEGDGTDKPCPDKADRVMMAHFDGKVAAIKLCDPHHDRMLALTTPHHF